MSPRTAAVDVFGRDPRDGVVGRVAIIYLAGIGRGGIERVV